MAWELYTKWINKGLSLERPFYQEGDQMQLYLAALAGYTDPCFRKIVEDFHPAGMTTEMVSMRALYYGDKKTLQMLTPPDNPDTSLQIFGDDPDIIGVCLEKYLNDLPNFSAFELNMGCPAPKIVKSGAGSALLKDLDRAGRIMEVLKEKANRPVGIKTRKGFDEDTLGLNAAKLAEKIGLDYVIIHGRTRAMYYDGLADWDFIHQVAREVSLPVFGNGDITSPQMAEDQLKEGDLAGIYIGRGAIGNPWIFAGKEPSLEDRFQVMKRHLNLALDYYDPYRGIREMRKHFIGYVKGLPGSKKLKQDLVQCKDREEVEKCLENYLQTRPNLDFF